MLEILVNNGSDICEMRTVTSSHSRYQLSELAGEQLGEGVSRSVYALSETMVLKLEHEDGSYIGGPHEEANRNEVALWESLSEEEQNQGTFARIYAYADDYSWLIMERIPYIGTGYPSADDRYLLSDCNVGDLHGGNFGSREDDSYAVIDYAVNRESVEGSGNGFCPCGDSDCGADVWCECGECECTKCFPEGCACDEFEGCNVVDCERCESQALNARVMAAGNGKVSLSWHPSIQGPENQGARGGRVRPLHKLPSKAVRRLERFALEHGGNRNAETHRHIPEDSRNYSDNIVVCRECAQEMDNEPVTPDNQMVLKFSNTYVVSVRFVAGWINGRYFANGVAQYIVINRWSGLVLDFGPTYGTMVKRADFLNGKIEATHIS